MILGIGTDIVKTERIGNLYKKYGDKLLDRILHLDEIKHFDKLLSVEKKIFYLAKRFCAKESLVKSIGTGFHSKIFLRDICIINDKLGKPYYHIESKIDQYIKEIFMVEEYKIHLSISDDTGYAIALSIIEKV